MITVLIILAVFFGIAMCIGIVAASILLANGKLTLPNTNMRRIQQARIALQVAEIRLEQERIAMTTDAQIELRLKRAALPGGGQDESS